MLKWPLRIFLFSNLVLPLPAANAFFWGSLQKLKCNDEQTKKFEIDKAEEKTEGGNCPDCDRAKEAGMDSVLQIPRIIAPVNSDQLSKDDAAVAKWNLVDYGYNFKSYGEVFDSEPVRQKIARSKKTLLSLNSCLEGKFNSELTDVKENIIYFNKTRAQEIAKLPSSRIKTFQAAQKIKGNILDNESFKAYCEIYYMLLKGAKSSRAVNEMIIKDKKSVENDIKKSETNLDHIKKGAGSIPRRMAESGARECDLRFEEFSLIHQYCGDLYKCLNQALRGVELGWCELDKKTTESVVRTMNSGLAKIAPYKGTVYRGVEALPDGVLNAHKVGAIIQFSSYLSTSMLEKGAFYGRYHYVIASKTGRIVAPISGMRWEAEVLFAPKAKFKITRIEEDEHEKKFFLEEL
jgi:hypothetical protein